ncbi:grasp-with-spasm system ATP-grasp peptide maturase [Taibaiella koreensis]|uniref:grasp-with-spasm system ATP-grasp peptide maturase n=1 Tax=Taibaiella koreensis TaxID=1268548 RepID=UPI000E59F73E|nr:grasp-with-spasm system ATP-grasp peptide maturase [Taibaiella koreensis]
MVLILSENRDPCTIEILKWLDHFGTPWLRINEDDEVAFECLEYRDNQLIQLVVSVNGRLVDLVRIKAYWYRRGWLQDSQGQHGALSPDAKINRQLSAYLGEELDNVLLFIHRYLQTEKPHISSFLNAGNDKTYYLMAAIKAGLSVPDTLICNKKKRLAAFAQRTNGNRTITKSINELFSFSCYDKFYTAATYEVSREEIAACSDRFFPSLFQGYVEKYCELRVFYLLGELYAMAIFSQQNEQTRLDFRNYDHDHANRNVPFSLPEAVEQSIRDFMTSIRLNCGSLDFILTPDMRFVFLEVNPVGQFGMVSYPCNYQLERRVATALNDML